MRRSLLFLGARVMHLLRFFLYDPRLFLRYISTGATAAIVEAGLFILLYQELHWPLLAANMLALCCALLLCFALHKHWTFGARGGAKRQLKLYLLMQAVSMLLNNLLITIFITVCAWQPLLAKLVQIGIVFVWNFSFCKLVIFQPERPTPQTPPAQS